MFIVNYVDDFGRKHLTIARDISELRFLEDRFGDIYYEPVDQPQS